MEILSQWILKLVVLWMMSCIIESRIVEQLNEAKNHNVGGIANSHIDPIEKELVRRESDFDRGYEEFLRNYHNDNDIERNERHGRYRVQESNESVSNESDETSESAEDSIGSESEEIEEKPKKYKSMPQSKSNNKQQNKHSEQNNNKKNKYCKMEKRKNMLCNICYNPKEDEKTESCSYNSEPKDHSYEYSEDKTYVSKDKEPESFEGSGSNEFDDSEHHRKAPKSKKTQFNGFNRYPVYRRPQQQKFYPTYSIRPISSRNVGPQTFLPQALQPFPGVRGKPIRLQMNGPPPDVAFIRYRTIESPFSSQRIRVVMYPKSQQNHQNQSKKHNRPPGTLPEIRPPRDINGAESESLLSNVTKEHQFEYFPSHLSNGANRKYFMMKRRSKCRKLMENNKMCFECYVDGERRKECMFTSKPKRFFESYSTSKKSKKSKTKHPHGFDICQNEYRPEIHGDKWFKDSDQPNVDMKTMDPEVSSYKELPNETDKLPYYPNSNRNQPNVEPLRAVPDVIYGTTQPQPEPLALLYQTDLTFGTNDKNQNNHPY